MTNQPTNHIKCIFLPTFLVTNIKTNVIIGISIFKRVRWMKGTTMVILGSLIYKASYQIVLSLGIPTEWNNFIKALIFLVALVIGKPHFSRIFKGMIKKPEKEGANASAE